MANPSLLRLDGPAESVVLVALREPTRHVNEHGTPSPAILLAGRQIHFFSEISERTRTIKKCHMRCRGTLQQFATSDDAEQKYLLISVREAV